MSYFKGNMIKYNQAQSIDFFLSSLKINVSERVPEEPLYL